MKIKPAGSQASVKGPADWFTGSVRINLLFQASPPSHIPGASVTCEPGHGATSTTGMTHIAIEESLDGSAVEWMEQVSEKEYQAGSK